MRRCTVAMVLMVALSGCSQAFQQAYGIDPQAQRTIEIRLPISPAQAAQRVQLAAVRGGWTVTATSPGVVTIGPYKLAEHNEVSVTLHANVIGSDSASTIVLSGTKTDAAAMAFDRSLAGDGAAKQDEGAPIVAATKGREAWTWAELQRFADAVWAAK